MKAIPILALAATLGSCTVERVGPPGVTFTRPVVVKSRDVLVFADAALMPGKYSVVEEIWVKDDGNELPRVLESRLRTKAGALGANAIVLYPSNRRANATRIDLRPTFDNPFDYFQATAVWLGEGTRPETYLGTKGSKQGEQQP